MVVQAIPQHFPLFSEHFLWMRQNAHISCPRLQRMVAASTLGGNQAARSPFVSPRATVAVLDNSTEAAFVQFMEEVVLPVLTRDLAGLGSAAGNPLLQKLDSDALNLVLGATHDIFGQASGGDGDDSDSDDTPAAEETQKPLLSPLPSDVREGDTVLACTVKSNNEYRPAKLVRIVRLPTFYDVTFTQWSFWRTWSAQATMKVEEGHLVPARRDQKAYSETHHHSNPPSLAVSAPRFSLGDEVKITNAAGTGTGAVVGVYPGRVRFAVKYDDGAVVETEASALRGPPLESEVRRVQQAQLAALQLAIRKKEIRCRPVAATANLHLLPAWQQAFAGSKGKDGQVPTVQQVARDCWDALRRAVVDFKAQAQAVLNDAGAAEQPMTKQQQQLGGGGSKTNSASSSASLAQRSPPQQQQQQGFRPMAIDDVVALYATEQVVERVADLAKQFRDAGFHLDDELWQALHTAVLAPPRTFADRVKAYYGDLQEALLESTLLDEKLVFGGSFEDSRKFFRDLLERYDTLHLALAEPGLAALLSKLGGATATRQHLHHEIKSLGCKYVPRNFPPAAPGGYTHINQRFAALQALVEVTSDPGLSELAGKQVEISRSSLVHTMQKVSGAALKKYDNVTHPTKSEVSALVESLLTLVWFEKLVPIVSADAHNTCQDILQQITCSTTTGADKFAPLGVEVRTCNSQMKPHLLAYPEFDAISAALFRQMVRFGPTEIIDKIAGSDLVTDADIGGSGSGSGEGGGEGGGGGSGEGDATTPRVRSDQVRANLRTSYDSFKQMYDAIVDRVRIKLLDLKLGEGFSSAFDDVLEAQLQPLRQLAANLGRRNSSSCELVLLLLSLAFSHWTLSTSKVAIKTILSDMNHTGRTSTDPSNYMKEPHAAQVVSILRLLGMDRAVLSCLKKRRKAGAPLEDMFKLKRIEDRSPINLRNHAAQILTGEGKSVTLAGLAIIFAILGYEVHCVCYSNYLSKRDYQAFEVRAPVCPPVCASASGVHIGGR